MKPISIIIPVRNESAVIAQQSEHWRHLVEWGVELCFVDGGSEDGTREALESLGFHVLSSAPGRARQMNLGGQELKGAVLLFLHADTRLPRDGVRYLVEKAAADHSFWGRFDVEIQGNSRWFPLISRMINLRSRLSGIATGDQAIFICRRLFEEIGGFPEQPLMEDVELSKRLLKRMCPLCLAWKVETSGRRWETYGVWRTIVLMWALRFAYWRGVSAVELKRRYP